MKGAIKVVTIKGKEFEVKKCGASLAIECQSVFVNLIKDNGVGEDEDTDRAIDLMSAMTRDIVTRIKHIFIECVVSPKITVDSFEDLNPNTITQLFLAVQDYQTAEAEAKKKEPTKSDE